MEGNGQLWISAPRGHHHQERAAARAKLSLKPSDVTEPILALLPYTNPTVSLGHTNPTVCLLTPNTGTNNLAPVALSAFSQSSSIQSISIMLAEAEFITQVAQRTNTLDKDTRVTVTCVLKPPLHNTAGFGHLCLTLEAERRQPSYMSQLKCAALANHTPHALHEGRLTRLFPWLKLAIFGDCNSLATQQVLVQHCEGPHAHK